MKILGIDPGYAILGYGVVEKIGNKFKVCDYGAITTDAGTPMTERLEYLYDSLREIIEEHHPDVASIEELFFNTNITTGIAVAHGRGIILFTAEKLGVPVFEYTPSQVKQAVVGYGKAEKRQVMDMTKRLLKLRSVPRPDDAADALALAICHARSATSLLRQNPFAKPTV